MKLTPIPLTLSISAWTDSRLDSGSDQEDMLESVTRDNGIMFSLSSINILLLGNDGKDEWAEFESRLVSRWALWYAIASPRLQS